MSKMDLGFTLSSELLGSGYENIRFQRALHLTQVLNVWCDDAVRDKSTGHDDQHGNDCPGALCPPPPRESPLDLEVV